MHDVFYRDHPTGLFAFERPASSLEHAAQLSRTKFFWYAEGVNDYTGVDFYFRPPPWEADHTYVWPDQWNQYGGLYLSSKDHASKLIYHFVDQIVPALPCRDNWHMLHAIDETQFNFSWRPHPKDPPYIYVWGNQHWPAEKMPTVEYHVTGATERKYMGDAVMLPDMINWTELYPVDNFDFSWCPDPGDPPYCYVFGNQHYPGSIMPTLIYTVENGTTIKYVDDVVAILAPSEENWTQLDPIAKDKWDWTWRPNPKDPPYEYVFGNRWYSAQQKPSITYKVPGATQIKFMDEPRTHRVASPELFNILTECEFDYTWEPDPGSPPYIYVFGNQWYPPEIMPTVEYHVTGATERKFMAEPVARLTERHDNHWHTLVDCKWDYSWRPDPGDPPYIYIFGNQWHSAEIMPTVKYTADHATEIKYMDAPRARLLQQQERWTVPEGVDCKTIDFSWTPDPGSPPYIYHFGSDYQISTGVMYTVPGATEDKFEGAIPTFEQHAQVIEVPDIFFIDKMNASSAVRFQRLKDKYSTAQKVRYANSIMETITRCLARTKLRRFWVVTSENVYDDFDFAWHPASWQGYMTHVFGSQWQKWSETFLINRHEFERNAKWAGSIAEFPNLNFVQDQKVILPDDLFEIWYVDMMNPESAAQLERLQSRYSKINTVRFVDNYLDTFKRIVDRASTEYVWIVNSNCNYAKWDFSWRPEVWQEDMLHVFATADQEFGDTFFTRTDLFKEQLNKITDLAFYETINYTREQIVERYDTEVVTYDSDTLVDAVRAHRFQHAYAYFRPRGSENNVAYTPSLWKGSERSIHLISKSGSHALVPRDAQLKLETQLYDYPYILKHRNRFVSDHPLDIIYLSNGEPDADHWYEVLLDRTKTAPNRVKRVQNVNGRAAAYQACASASETAWFFTVFAKLEVVEDFDWAWQPDRLQEPKHYIFNAKNPVNGLEYGHMGMIAYNSKLTLATNKWGLDFTLSKAHEVVPELSGIAHYNQDAWTAWRTAFREVIKLRAENSDISNYRLSQWMTGTGAFADHSIKGARDAVEYYDSVDGDMERLLLTFEWDWLRDYYQLKA